MKASFRPLSVRTRLTLWYTGLLLVILVVIGGLSYRVLAWSIIQDLDASLLTVGRIIGALDHPWSDLGETALGGLVGPEFHDKFFQFVDPQGRPGPRSAMLRESLPLSPEARERAARGERTLETIPGAGPRRIRLLTMPVVHAGQPVQLVQVGIPLTRMDHALRNYLRILLALVPLGLGLAAVGGAVIARAALAPVDEMSRTARRITAEALGPRVPLRGTGDELDHLAQTLNGMLGRLEEAFDQMRRFAADAAHELRTPLTALKGGLEVALRAARSPDEYRRVLDESLEDVNRLITLAEDLLLLSRTSSGMGIGRDRVELEPVLLDVYDVGLRLGKDKGVSVGISSLTQVAVEGNESALRRVTLNLVENAIKYTPSGGSVRLSLARAAGTAVVVVEDTGIGIEPAELERIFQPFVRLDAARSRETGGSGLGLAIARSVAVAHGGTLSVESNPGTGSRFTLRLPAA